MFEKSRLTSQIKGRFHIPDQYIYIYSSSSTLAGLSYHICGKLEVAFKASPSSQHQHCTDEAQKAETVLSAVSYIYSYFEKGCRKKVHATILKGIEGDFKCTVFQRNLKESYTGGH